MKIDVDVGELTLHQCGRRGERRLGLGLGPIIGQRRRATESLPETNSRGAVQHVVATRPTTVNLASGGAEEEMREDAVCHARWPLALAVYVARGSGERGGEGCCV